MSLTVQFDPTMPYDGVGYNRGCPPGYFAQFVPAGEEDSSQPPSIIVPGGPTAIRCRMIEGYTDIVNANESGQVSADSWLNYVSTVGEFAGDVTSGLSFGVQSILPWALVGLAVMLLVRR